MPIDHQLEPEDCLSRLAYEHGFYWKTLWEHEANTGLRLRRRSTPYALFPGEILVIPEREKKHFDCQTEHTHVFRQLGIPGKLRVRLLFAGRPRRGVQWAIDADGTSIQGTTDDDGRLEAAIHPRVNRARLVIHDGTHTQVFWLRIGLLDPADEISGAQQRLHNLGYECETSREMDSQTRQAIQSFQAKHQLNPNGELNDKTQKQLRELHGS